MNALSPHGTRIGDLLKRQLEEGKTPNRLIREKSPYLLQHAYNPVDWFTWGDEAFAKARAENKPVFLSVGYATCYWCHVMEREIFENDSIAALMNRTVVSIKVDREERPDVDHIYMAALQAMTGSGGWPMSVFMTPDRLPFYAATYLPPVSAHGRPSFPDVLKRIAAAWEQERGKIDDVSLRVREFLAGSAVPAGAPLEAGVSLLEPAFRVLAGQFDELYGGFGAAPKFPRPSAIRFLVRHHHRTGDPQALSMALDTLRRMADGGIYDHLGGGFHRYATDERWQVPHFEKMLCDQAQLAVCFLEAFQITRETFFRDVAEDVLRYVTSVLTHPEGGFFTAEDAESAGPDDPAMNVEGAFYVWTREELRAILSPDDAALFEYRYGVEADGNTGAERRGPLAHQNVLFSAHTIADAAIAFGRSEDEVRSVLERALAAVRRRRDERPRPLLDDKVLLGWNGLMISAFACAAQVLGEPAYAATAADAARFLLRRLSGGKDRTFLRRFRDGEARYDAHLSDYASFIQGLLDLYETTFDIEWLSRAVELTEEQVRLFADAVGGGFFDTSGQDETLVIRSKESFDGAEPSGNALAAMNLLRLARMTGASRYEELAAGTLDCFGNIMREHPDGVMHLLAAVDFRTSSHRQIIIAGARTDPAVVAMLSEIHTGFDPWKALLLADGGEGQRFLGTHVPFIAAIMTPNGVATAYVCENFACQLPTSDPKRLRALLDHSKG